mgnify:CR=1 FL=1
MKRVLVLFSFWLFAGQLDAYSQGPDNCICPEMKDDELLVAYHPGAAIGIEFFYSGAGIYPLDSANLHQQAYWFGYYLYSNWEDFSSEFQLQPDSSVLVSFAWERLLGKYSFVSELGGVVFISSNSEQHRISDLVVAEIDLQRPGAISNNFLILRVYLMKKREYKAV